MVVILYKSKIICLLIILIVFSKSSFSQDFKLNEHRECFYLQIDNQIESILNSHYFIDSLKISNIIFAFKIDSLGEVHSAHIRKSGNLKNQYYFSICTEIEEKLSFKSFINSCYYDLIDFSKHKKYGFITYPYKQSPTEQEID